MDIAAVTPDTLEPYLRHLVRLFGESGRGGVPLLYPFPPTRSPTRDDLREARATGMKRDTTELSWRRMWAAMDGDRVSGSVELAGATLVAASHRSGLMIGVERSHWGRGAAPRLMETALVWARAEPRLAWLDVEVFARNEPAIRLYERFGFERTITTPDCFRVAGESILAIRMCCSVGSAE